jgi:pimeloyl-ACP methyl ester carboxylesterase
VNTFRWKSFIDTIDLDQFTVYAMDAPGHGASSSNICHISMYSQAIESFIDDLGQVDISIAHSIGGATLVYTAYRGPSFKLGKLVIIAAPGKVIDFFNFYKKMASLSNHTVNLVKDLFINKIGFTPEYFTVENFGKHIKNHALIIHDLYDDECPYENAVKLSTEMPNAKLLTTKGVGHGMKSKEIYEQIISFCKETK